MGGSRKPPGTSSPVGGGAPCPPAASRPRPAGMAPAPPAPPYLRRSPLGSRCLQLPPRPEEEEEEEGGEPEHPQQRQRQTPRRPPHPREGWEKSGCGGMQGRGAGRGGRWAPPGAAGAGLGGEEGVARPPARLGAGGASPGLCMLCRGGEEEGGGGGGAGRKGAGAGAAHRGKVLRAVSRAGTPGPAGELWGRAAALLAPPGTAPHRRGRSRPGTGTPSTPVVGV